MKYLNYVFKEVDTRGGNHDEMKPGFSSKECINKPENQRGKAWFHFIMLNYRQNSPQIY